ncbi:helix-turn-helix domain-containing protein [Leucobacter luti]|uniref:helix-turn-helix domain-containing protein n=1 Tax=Leucobacter luti TaxID=340320 RepID=UPI001414FB32
MRAIAERLGVSRSTVSRWAKEDGLAFDRARTAQAVAAHSIDLAVGRQRLAERMLQRAEEALDDLDKPYLVTTSAARTTLTRSTSASALRSRCGAMLSLWLGSRLTS